MFNQRLFALLFVFFFWIDPSVILLLVKLAVTIMVLLFCSSEFRFSDIIEYLIGMRIIPFGILSNLLNMCKDKPLDKPIDKIDVDKIVSSMKDKPVEPTAPVEPNAPVEPTVPVEVKTAEIKVVEAPVPVKFEVVPSKTYIDPKAEAERIKAANIAAAARIEDLARAAELKANPAVYTDPRSKPPLRF